MPLFVGAYGGSLQALVIADNSGAAAPVYSGAMVRPTTGAVGANKIQEVGLNAIAVGDSAVGVDCFANASDPSNLGLWRRDLLLTCFVRKQATAGVMTADSHIGIGIGSYGAPPPYPAATNINVVRLFCRMSDGNWYLSIHRGDGVSAVSIVPLAGSGIGSINTGRTYRAQIYYKAGEYISAAIDGVEGANVTNPLPVQGILNFGALATCYVASGTDATANVRGVFYGLQIETFGKS